MTGSFGPITMAESMGTQEVPCGHCSNSVIKSDTDLCGHCGGSGWCRDQGDACWFDAVDALAALWGDE